MAPKRKHQCTLKLERFDITTKEWFEDKKLTITMCSEKFASGGFRDAFKCSEINGTIWVLKLYNEKAKDAIQNQMHTTLESHARKEVQMQEVARYIAQKLERKAPIQFGESLQYKKVYYTTLDDQPANIEEYILGIFNKYVNNNDSRAATSAMSPDEKEIFEKAQALSHFSYETTKRNIMLLDIQGAGKLLSDPEMATVQLQDDSGEEIYFCVGNLSVVAITTFCIEHVCSKYCELLGLPRLEN